ncbi:MAG: NusG domain II-containing protein [Oscillospiraceae bacterium]
MNRKIIAAWLILAAACIAGIAVFLLLKAIPYNSPEAVIYSDGEVVRTVPLSESCEFTVQTDRGFNTIVVADGSISVANSDCPDKVCIHTGAISSGAVPIICLPHRLEIRIVSADDDIDAAIN